MPTPPDFTAGTALAAASLNAVGLWRITPTGISGTGASLSGAKITLTTCTAAKISGVFSADYENYLLVGRAITTTGDIYAQFMVGTTETTTNYNYAMMQAYAGAGVTAVRTAGTTALTMFAMGAGTTTYCSSTVDIFAPQLATATLWQCTNNRSDNSYGLPANYLWHGNQSDNTQFDGLRLFSAGNITGTFYIYGRRG